MFESKVQSAVLRIQDCCGHAPAYGEGARETLRETMYALRHLFHEAMGPLHDSRTGQDLLPALLQGKTLRRHLLDLSGFHTAVLWLGPSIVAAGEQKPEVYLKRGSKQPEVGLK